MNGTALPKPLKQGVVRLMVMENTYGCVRQVEDLQGPSMGSKASAALSSPAEPKQIQVRPCNDPSAILSADTVSHRSQCSKLTHHLSKGAFRIKCISQAMSYLCSSSSSSRETPWPLLWDSIAQHCLSKLR